MATDPETLDRAAHKKAKASPKAKSSSDCGPTITSLRAKVDRAARQGPKGRRDIGKMTHAERGKYLFGT